MVVMLINVCHDYLSEDKRSVDYTIKMLIPANYVTKLIGQSNYYITQKDIWFETSSKDQEEPWSKFYQINKKKIENALSRSMEVKKTKSMPFASSWNKYSASKMEDPSSKVANQSTKT